MEIYKCDYDSENLEELAMEYKREVSKCIKLRIIASERLTSTKGLELFTSIEELDLSGNKIKALEGHTELKNLRNLNLSCNLIRTIPDLSSLNQLRKLNISGNKISSLVGIKSISQMGLQSLIMYDNNLNNLKELKLLQAFPNLKEIIFHKSLEQSNPYCRDLRLYYSEAIQLDNIEKIILDGKDATQIADYLYAEMSSKNKNMIDEPRKKPVQAVDWDKPALSRSNKVADNIYPSSKDYPVDELVPRYNARVEERPEPRSAQRKNYAIDDDRYESIRVFEITQSNAELKEKLGNALNVGKEKDKLMAEKESVLKNTVNHLQQRLDEYETIINKLSNQLKAKDAENVRLQHKVSGFESSISEREKTIQSLADKLQTEIQLKLEFKYKAEHLNDNTVDREFELRSIKDKYQNSQLECKKLEHELSLLREKYSFMDFERRSRDQEKKEKEGSLSGQYKNLEEEYLKLKMENMEIKNEVMILKEREKLVADKADMEARQRYKIGSDEMENDFKNKINELIQEKRDLEATFKYNLDKMEEELKIIIKDLADKNSAMSREVNNLRNEKVS